MGERNEGTSGATAGTVTLPVRQPAEWERHEAVWLAWPSHADLWGDALDGARAAFVRLARAIADVGPDGVARGERLEVLVPDAANERLAREALAGLPVRLHPIPFGDIWMRDIAPIFLHDARGRVFAARFRFNGWGQKYVLPHDDRVAERVAAASGLPARAHPFVLEGGSVETDGEGTILTSRQCLLNPNRNAEMNEAQIERALCDALGGHKVVWVSEGLRNDHTDGHIDTIARYVAPGVVAVMWPTGVDDPNRDVLLRLREEVASLVDARGRRLRVVDIPSPGRVDDAHGEPMPASHLNFYVGNRAVVVPTYGTATADAAVAAVAALFPHRRVVGVDARALLAGGGAFHCITQQQPSPIADDARVACY
jgi:agmatine deiminase